MMADTPTPFVLAADIGGTNTNLAVMDGDRILFSRRYATGADPSPEAALLRFLSEADASSVPRPTLSCVCGAGLVRDGVIRMSNAAWILDQAAIAASLGMPCFLINDFSAVAWGILTLHADRDDELAVLRRPDGSAAHGDPWGPMVALGAGTGLGCAWTTRDGGRPRVYPSEGGHVSIPVYDDQSERLASWLKARYSRPAGVEAAVSGQGLANIFLFLSGVDAHPTQTSLDILSQPESRRPALIAAAAGSDSLCARAMTMFVELYARTAANMALAFMPSGGIYLAGGVAAKNLAWFTDGALFMRNFLDSYREHTRAILEDTPVYVVRNYDISLVGASYAARVLSGAEDSA